MELSPQEAAQAVRAAVFASARASNRSPALRQRRLKPSRYNVTIPLRNGRALVYNGVSGAFALWEREDLEAYEGIDGTPADMRNPSINNLFKGGYMVAADTDELGEIEQRYKAIRFGEASLGLTIAPTLACNFGCDYCFQGQDKPGGNMSEEVQEALLAYVGRKLPTLRNLSVTWYGGEPLIARNLIYGLSDRFIAMCAQAKIGYSAFIVTNGFSLTREVAEALYARRVTQIQVTLDGPEHYHDGRRYLLSGRPTYRRIVDNLCEVVPNVPLQLSIRVNIDDRNQGEIRALIDDLAARGLSGHNNFRLYFAPVEAITAGCHSCDETSMTKTTYGRLEAELTQYAFERQLTGLPRPPKFLGTCGAVRSNSLVVTPTGDLHKCWDTVMEPGMKVGTIFAVDQVVDNALFQRWMEWTPFANAVCRGCKILPNCVGFCAYKFIHSDQTLGEAGSLPCPSWKFNVHERLFLRAEKLGMVSRDEWDDERSPTSPDDVGLNHTYESVQQGGAARGARGKAAMPLPILGQIELSGV
jgi:uncharacterized protein